MAFYAEINFLLFFHRIIRSLESGLQTVSLQCLLMPYTVSSVTGTVFRSSFITDFKLYKFHVMSEFNNALDYLISSLTTSDFGICWISCKIVVSRSIHQILLCYLHLFTGFHVLTNSSFLSKEKCQRSGSNALGYNAAKYFRKRIFWTSMGRQERREGTHLFTNF